MKPNKSIELWKGSRFEIITITNPHIPPSEGTHIIIFPLKKVPHSWSDPQLTGETFRLAAIVCQISEKLNLAPWFNIQSAGNWGLLPGHTPSFHVHVYGRRKGRTWGQPIQLPLAPDTYDNDPMTEDEISRLRKAFESELSAEEF